MGGIFDKDFWKINRHDIGLDSDHFGNYLKDGAVGLLTGNPFMAARDIYVGRERRKAVDEADRNRAEIVDELNKQKSINRRIARARSLEQGVGDSTINTRRMLQINEVFDDQIGNVNAEYNRLKDASDDAWKSNVTGLFLDYLTEGKEGWEDMLAKNRRTTRGINEEFKDIGNTIGDFGRDLRDILRF